jgi:hypothetical protein
VLVRLLAEEHIAVLKAFPIFEPAHVV